MPTGHEAEVMQLFEISGAYRRGHYFINEDLHVDRYWDKLRLFEHPKYITRLAEIIAVRNVTLGAEFIVGPPLCGAILAYEVARQCGSKLLLVEHDKAGAVVLRRPRWLPLGARVLIVDDSLKTGATLLSLLATLMEGGATPVGAAVINRRMLPCGGVVLPLTIDSLLTVSEPIAVSAGECELCRKHEPLLGPIDT